MSNYILPAEWHTQSCVQLTWPHEDTDWRDYLDDITETFVQIAKAVAHYESLVIAAKYPERVREVLAENLNDDEMARVSIYECDNTTHGHATMPSSRLFLLRMLRLHADCLTSDSTDGVRSLLPIRTTVSTTPYIIKVYSAANVSTMTTLCLRAVR